MYGEEGFLICFGLLALSCMLASLPLAIIALVMAARTRREVRRLAETLERTSPVRPAPSPAPLRPTPAPQAAPAERVTTPTLAALEELTRRREAAGPPRAPAAEAPPAVAASPAAPAAGSEVLRRPIRLEEYIGLKVLAWAGVIVVLFGAAFFVKYGYDQGWFGRLPWMRVVIPAVFGLALLAAGEVFERKVYRVLARVCTGGGLTAMFGAAFVAWAPLKQPLIGDATAWAFMAAITVVAIILAVRYASLTVAVFSLVGGLAVPLLVRPERDPGHTLFLYIVAVNAGVLGVAYFKKWRALNLLALAGTILNVLVWLYGHYWQHGAVATEKLGFIVGYMTVLWAMFFAISIVYHLVGRRAPSDLDLPLTLINITAYFAGLYVLLRADHHAWLGPAAAVLGAAYLAEGLLVRRLAPAHVRFVLLQVAQALALLTLAIPIQLEGVFIPMAWAAEASVIFWLGLRLKDWRLRGVGLLVHLCSIVALAYYWKVAWDTPGPIIFNARTATFGAVALAMALSAWLYRRQPTADRNSGENEAAMVTAGAAHLLLMLLIGVEAYRWFETASEALYARNLTDWGGQLQDILWRRDTILAAGLALYGVAAVGLATALRRTFHHAFAIVAFVTAAGAIFFLRKDMPELESAAVWNWVGAAFAAVAACLAAATVVSRYARADLPATRGLAITYELLAAGVVLGLYLTELARVEDYVAEHGRYLEVAVPVQSSLFGRYVETGISLAGPTIPSLQAAGLAVMAGVLVLRGFWIGSSAHRFAGLAAMAIAFLILGGVALRSDEGYQTVLWQPRGVALLLLAAAMAMAAAGYVRRMPAASPERAAVGSALAVLVHVVVLACFTLEAQDFWNAHAQAWFPNEETHAWYARQATLSVGYALYAFGLLAAGIRWRSVMLRVLALALLGGTLLKVMLLDLSRLEAIWRILSLLGLGLLLLAASLLYYKYRHVLFRTEPAGTAGGGAKQGGS